MPARTRRSGSDAGLPSTASNGRGRPSQVTKVPALSVTGATGNTTSAARVTSVSRSSRATTNDAAASASRKACGSAVSSGSTPPTTRPPSSPLIGRGHDRVGVAAGLLGQAVDAPGGGDVDPGPGVGQRAAAGQQLGQAAGLDGTAVAGPARHPGQPGAGLRGQRDRGGVGAGRGREPLAEQDHRGAVDAVVALGAERLERGGLLARDDRDQLAVHLAQAAGGERRQREDPGARGAPATPCAAAGRSCRPRPRARARRGRRWRPTRGRRRSPRRPPGPVAATVEARNDASSAESGRARKSMSLVPSTARANRL